MKARGERIVIFGDSLSHPGSDAGPEQSLVTQGSNRASSAVGDLIGSLLLEQGAEAVMLDARVGRSATNYWRRERTGDLMAAIAEFRPTKAIVMLGTNDIGLNAAIERTSFEAIRDTLKATGAEVWAVGPMTYVGSGAELNAGAQDVFDLMSEVFKGQIIDARPLAALTGRAGDGIHFTPSSAKATALAITQALLVTRPALGWIAYALGAAGLVGGAFLIYKLTGATRKALAGAQLALPPAPRTEDEHILWTANDALIEGDTKQGRKILEQLSPEARKSYRKSEGVFQMDGLKDASGADVITEAVASGNETPESVMKYVREQLKEGRETWIAENAELALENGITPVDAWEAWRRGFIDQATDDAHEMIEDLLEEKRDGGFDGLAHELYGATKKPKAPTRSKAELKKLMAPLNAKAEKLREDWREYIWTPGIYDDMPAFEKQKAAYEKASEETDDLLNELDHEYHRAK